jgi:rhodanese-related sulfurtransferase
MLPILENYWPLLLLAAWFIYKSWRTRSVLKQLPALMLRGAVLVDVRSPAEYASGHAAGSLNLPLPDLTHRASELPQSVPLVVGCASGTRSGMAVRQLKKMGFQEAYNIGSWRNFPDSL